MIIDQHNRNHTYLRISLTERCNLRCFYCMPEEGIPLRCKSEFMTKDEIVSIATTFVSLGINKIRLTGGEPLVRKDTHEIITELGKLPVELALTTNGVLVDQYIDIFKQAGLSSVNMSLDSLSREKVNTITRRKEAEKVFSNIDLLLKEGFKLKLNAVLIKGVNDMEIADFIEFTKNKNVQVRFIEFMPFDGNKWDWSKGVSSDTILKIVNGNFGKRNIIRIMDHPNDTARNYKISGFSGSFAIISSITNPFCDSCNRIRLTADGKIKNCLFSNNETDLLKALRQGKNIIPLILKTIWNKKAVRGGMNSFEEISATNKNRSMVAIGG